MNLSGRPQTAAWGRGEYLPSGAELAGYLADAFDYPPGQARDLVRVSEYAYVMNGSGPLYERLHEVFDADYPIGHLHRFLAALPTRIERLGHPRRGQLIVTTNYDDALERAFDAAQEPYDVVWYIAEGDRRGKFWHRAPGAAPQVIERPKSYDGLSLEERTVIMKIHGAVDRQDSERDSYVITEDHYIDYLTRTDISNLIPVTLAAKLRKSHFLFLGYSMRDWNLRVILHRIWGEQKLSYKSWAVQLNPDEIDREFWELRGVDILDVPLDRYVDALDDVLGDGGP